MRTMYCLQCTAQQDGTPPSPSCPQVEVEVEAGPPGRPWSDMAARCMRQALAAAPLHAEVHKHLQAAAAAPGGPARQRALSDLLAAWPRSVLLALGTCRSLVRWAALCPHAALLAVPRGRKCSGRNLALLDLGCGAQPPAGWGELAGRVAAAQPGGAAAPGGLVSATALSHQAEMDAGVAVKVGGGGVLVLVLAQVVGRWWCLAMLSCQARSVPAAPE